MLAWLGTACSDTSTLPLGPPHGARVTITPVSAPVATRSLAIAGTIRGQINTRIGAPYSFSVVLDGAEERPPGVTSGSSSTEYGKTTDAPTIFVRKPDGSLEYYSTMRGIVPNGTHTVVVRVSDSVGVVDSAVTQITTQVPDVRYVAKLLLPVAGDTAALASALNATGNVLGTTIGGGGRGRLVTWQGDAPPTVIAEFDTSSLVAASMNDRGDVLATISTGTGPFACTKAFIKPVGATPIIIDPAFPCRTRAIDINNVGSVLLAGLNSDYGLYENGVYTEHARTWVVAINDAGAYVGRYFSVYGDVRPAYFRFPGIAPPPPGSSIAPSAATIASAVPVSNGGVLAINNRNHAVEFNTPALAVETSWQLVRADGPPISFRPALGGYDGGFEVLSLNNQDVALAWAANSSTAFLWANGRASRVQVVSPGVALVGVQAINDANAILGRARVEGHSGVVAVLLIPAT
jgi:hypothetical protein